MRALLTSLRVDYDQWKALTIVALKLDFRLRHATRQGATRSDRITRRVLTQVLVNVLFGVAIAVVIPIIRDRFLAGVFVTTYLMFMVATTMMVGHNAAIISPSDYGILGFRPVTSRTYFAARLTNVLVYTLAMTLAVSLLPVLFFLFTHGLAAGAALMLGLCSSAVFVTLAIATAYASLLRIVGVTRLRNFVSYLQLITGVALYGGYFMLGRIVPNVPAALSESAQRLLVLFPPAWFASYAELAAGSANGLHWLSFLISLLALGVLLFQLRGRLSLEYAQRISELSAGTAVSHKPVRAGPAAAPNFLKRETRAVTILVRSHFRHDLAFRMSVLGVLPLTIIYLIIGFQNNRGFEAGEASGRGLWAVAVPALMLPTILKSSMSHSAAFQASWIFFASPSDRARIILAGKNVLLGFFVLPYLVLLGSAIVIMGVAPLYAVLLTTLIGLLSHMVMLIVTRLEPELPFSLPPADKSAAGRRVFLSMIVIGIVSAVIPPVARWAYNSLVVTGIVFGTIAVVTLVLNRSLRQRIGQDSAILEYRG